MYIVVRYFAGYCCDTEIFQTHFTFLTRHLSHQFSPVSTYLIVLAIHYTSNMHRSPLHKSRKLIFFVLFLYRPFLVSVYVITTSISSELRSCVQPHAVLVTEILMEISVISASSTRSSLRRDMAHRR